GLLGVVYGAVIGFTGNRGILGSLEKGVVTGIGWAIFGLAAGCLYGLWAGRAVSGGRLKGISTLLPPDTSLILAWGEGAITAETVAKLATNDSQRLIMRFHPLGHGAVLKA